MAITRKLSRRKTITRSNKNKKTKNNLNTDIVKLKLKAKLNSIYSKIKLNKNTYKDLINNIIKKQSEEKEKYKNLANDRLYKHKFRYSTQLAIINIQYNGLVARYNIVNKNDIPRDTRIDNIKTFLINLCKWIERTKRHSEIKINTCLLIWISDRPVLEIENIDKQLPICTYSQPKNMNFIMIPDGTFTVLNETKRYSNVGINWEQQKQLFKKIENNKKKEIYFRGKDTTIDNTNLRAYIYDKLKNEKDNEFKNSIEYEFLTKYNYQSVQEMKQYKFLLNLPGRYPWSTRLKYLYLSHSFIINVRVKTIIDNNPSSYHDQFESFIDYIVPDSNCINIDMIHYYSSDTDLRYKYSKYADIQKEECEKVYNKIKEIYYEYKNKDENKDKKVMNSYKLINKLTTNHMYEYYYEILLRNQELGMEPYVMD